MKKFFLLPAFLLLISASLPSTNISAQETPTETEKRGGYIWTTSDGCHYLVVTHSVLWGLFSWEEDPVLIACDPPLSETGPHH